MLNFLQYYSFLNFNINVWLKSIFLKDKLFAIFFNFLQILRERWNILQNNSLKTPTTSNLPGKITLNVKTKANPFPKIMFIDTKTLINK